MNPDEFAQVWSLLDREQLADVARRGPEEAGAGCCHSACSASAPAPKVPPPARAGDR